MCAHHGIHSINRNCLGKIKLVSSIKLNTATLSITKKLPLRKNDHVKAFEDRQVKASVILFSLCALNFSATAADDVDLLLQNGNVYTVNGKNPHAEAIAVKDGRVVFVGSSAEAKKFHANRVVDLGGK